MIRKPNILIAMLVLAPNVVTISACKRISGCSTREVEVKQFVDLNRFGDILKRGSALSGSSISLDEQGNIYLLDMKSHRIVIINKNGEDIGQIGQIGQDKESLFNPLGISVDNGKIYILNNSGEEIKAFTLDNHFLWSTKLNDSWMPEPIAVKGGRCFIAEKTTNAKDFNQNRLINVRDINGEFIKTFGRIIPCESYIGYLDFNMIYFQVIKDRIFGAHRHYPVLFAYELDGRELFYRYLNTLVPEIKELDERIKEKGLDTPETKKKEDDGSSKVLLYCFGFGVDRRQDIYYSMQISDEKSAANHRYFVIRLDKWGNPIEKIIYKKEGRSLRVGPIVANPENKLYAVAFDDKNVVFFPL